MIHHVLLQGGEVEPTIDTDKNEIVGGGDRYDYTDYCAIDVTPDSMETSIALVDTGDGTSWCSAPSPNSGTGDYSFRCRMLSDNDTGSPRSCTARITDDAGEATQVDVTVTQQIQIT